MGCNNDVDADAVSAETSSGETTTEAGLVDRVARATGPGRLQTSGEGASAAGGTPSLEIPILLSAYDPDRHYSYVEELASDAYEGRLVASPGARLAAGVIEKHFADVGLTPWTEIGLDSFRQDFSLEGITDDNIIGIMPGTDSNAGYVILAAHYDHKGVSVYGTVYNGADDDAAGVGAVMEAARLISSSGLRPVKTIVFCAFSGEEAGQLGSRALGSLIAAEGLSGEVEMLNIDGIGATGGSYLGVWDEGASGAAPLVNALRMGAGYTGVSVIEEGTDIGSDAQPFAWQFGIPAVTIDWDWGSDPSEFHPYYHSPDDDAANINRTVMTRATRAILAGLWLLVADSG